MFFGASSIEKQSIENLLSNIVCDALLQKEAISDAGM